LVIESLFLLLAHFFEDLLLRSSDGKTRYWSLLSQYIKIKHIKKWITFLRKHLCPINTTDDERKQIVNWVNNVRIEQNYLKRLINDLKWRKSEMLNY